MADVTVYRYDEKKGRYGGVPARDLTQDDYDRLSLKLQAAVDQEGSPYTKLTKKEQEELRKQLEQEQAPDAGDGEK